MHAAPASTAFPASTVAIAAAARPAGVGDAHDSAPPNADGGGPRFYVLFQSLFHHGRGLVFPCDRHGRVDLDALSERARNNYLYARATVGREHCSPLVCTG